MIKYLDLCDPVILLDKNGIEKTAEEKKDEVDGRIMKVIKDLKPDKDKCLYTYKSIMGDGEAWGSNKNGDFFPKCDLYADNDKYGYKTFLRAGIFTLHRNKDKGKSLGKIILSVVNPIMRRIELIEELDRDLCNQHDKDFHVYDKLLDGEILFSSMGCRVPYDVCSICGNKAPSRGQYCDDLLYRMNQILPDGRRVYAINPKPDFFDDSYVRNPAFTPAFTINIFRSNEDVAKHSKEEKHEKTAGKKVVEEKDYKGLPVAVEVKKNSFRFRKFYKTLMHCDYGYIKGTQGEDGEEIDVYMINKDSDKVYRIKQLKKGTGQFDEYKYILGARSEDEAKGMYLRHMPELFFGGIKEIPFDAFKQLVTEKEKTAEYKSSDIIKRIPAMTINTDVLKKIKFK